MKSTEERINEWLFFAQEDLLAAEQISGDLFNIICFHAHQCVEKTLKAFLVTPETIPPKIHNLKELYKRILKLHSEFLEFKEEIEWMNQFYIPTRYPDTFVGGLPEGLPTKEDAEKAIEIARKVFEKGKKILEQS